MNLRSIAVQDVKPDDYLVLPHDGGRVKVIDVRGDFESLIVSILTAAGRVAYPQDHQVTVERPESEAPREPQFEILYSRTEFYTAVVEAENSHKAVTEFHAQGWWIWDQNPVMEEEVKVLSVKPLDECR